MEKAIIIGAGIAGLVTGILLKRQGIQVALYERRSAIQPIGGGIGIWPNGSQVLLKLASAEKILALAANITHDKFADQFGKTIKISAREHFLQVNGYPILNICRSDLHHLLADELGSEHICFNKTCMKLDQTSDRVQVTLSDGSQDEADVVIGADGVHSTVRKHLFPTISLNYAGYIQLLGIGQIQPKQSIDHNFIWGKNRCCLNFPIPGNRYMFYLARPYPQSQLQQKRTRAEQLSLFYGWSDEVDELLATYGAAENNNSLYFCGEAYDMPALPAWHDKRIALVGDAAHPLGSILGLAAGIALEDSATLVNYLVNCEQVEMALALYEKQQIPRFNALMQYEHEIKQFLLQANDKAYTKFITDLRAATNEQSFINHLKPALP